MDWASNISTFLPTYGQSAYDSDLATTTLEYSREEATTPIDHLPRNEKLGRNTAATADREEVYKVALGVISKPWPFGPSKIKKKLASKSEPQPSSSSSSSTSGEEDSSEPSDDSDSEPEYRRRKTHSKKGKKTKKSRKKTAEESITGAIRRSSSIKNH
jgi:hypothetical protein